MKRSYLATALVIILIALTWNNLLGQGKKKTDSKINWVDIEKICIEYEHTGMQKGKQMVYLGDRGNEQLTILDVVMEMGPIKQRTHTATYLKGNKIYTIDLETNKGTVTENPMRNNISEKQLEQFDKEFMNKFGKDVGTKELLGKICRVFEMPSLGTITYIWKKITLKSVTGLGNMKQIMEAVKIIFDFDMEIFNLPTNVNFEETEESPNLDDIMDKMKGIGIE